ncbi:MAG: energy-coupling factor transporter transmembrane component T [Tissierellia bacterium]|nr:energy-coupling factor transporter transmembrane component T [Tissierellia bacterium]
MLKDITIGQYYPVDSPVHRLDPRFKILLMFIFIISLFFMNSFVAYLLVVVWLGVVSWASRVPFKMLTGSVKALRWILLFTMLINLFFTPGDPIFQWKFMTITDQGLSRTLMMAMRLVLLVMGTSLLTLTTSPIQLTDGIEKLLSPLKKVGFPAHSMAMMITIALRFIPTLIEETDKIMKAQMARGADFESGNLMTRAKSLVPLLVPLFLNAMQRAYELADAMESRCYRGEGIRTRLNELVMTQKDILLFVVNTLILVLIAGLRVLPLP